MQHIPILRYLARELGQYDGVTSADKYLVDAVADVYIDWRVSVDAFEILSCVPILTLTKYNWVTQLKAVTEEFTNKFLPWYYRVITKYYAERDGPYLLGDKITYVDFAVYQSLDNDERIGANPVRGPLFNAELSFLLTVRLQPKLSGPLLKLKEAIEARPKIAAYLKETRIGGA